MDDVLADLSLNHSPDSQDGLLELSIGTDAIQATFRNSLEIYLFRRIMSLTMMMIHLSMRLRRIV